MAAAKLAVKVKEAIGGNSGRIKITTYKENRGETLLSGCTQLYKRGSSEKGKLHKKNFQRFSGESNTRRW